MSGLTRRGHQKPPNHGRHYRDGELALIYLVGRSVEAQKILADLLGRTEDTIDLIWGWCDGRKYPRPQATNQIEDQLPRVKPFAEALRPLIGTRP